MEVNINFCPFIPFYYYYFMNFDPSFENELEIHSKICSLFATEQFGSYNKNNIDEDCWTIMNKLKVLIYEYFDERNQNEVDSVNMQLMYQHINQNFFNLHEYYIVIHPKILSAIPNFFEAVLMPVAQFYIKQWNTLNTSLVLHNVAHEKNQYFTQCLCQIETNTNIIQHCITDNQFCYRCGETFHNNCFKTKSSQLYQCSFCFLRYCLPDRQVVSVLFKAYLPPPQQYQTSTSLIEIEWPLTQYCNQKISIQMRCTKIGEYELQWPETCDIYLDDNLSVTFKPLPVNSPLKSRHDGPVVIPIRDLSLSQKIKINEQYSTSSTYHLIGIFVVAQKNQKQIFEGVMKNDFFELKQAESKSYLQKLFWKTNFLEMDQLKISNKCQFYGQKIIYPCRSRHCINHYQPFDVYSFICSSVKAKGSIKRWKCPICGVRAYDIVRDLYLQKLLNQQNNPKQIGFIQEVQGQNVVINPKVKRQGKGNC